MTLRTRFLITALLLCHQLLAAGLVTSGLRTDSQTRNTRKTPAAEQKKPDSAPNSPCSLQAAQQSSDSATICAEQQEKDGDVYKLRGNVEIHYRTYILRADEVTYNDDSGEAIANGHFTVDGGPNDDHIKASHGNYNLTTEIGRFYDVIATTGMKFEQRNRVFLTSTAPFAFTGKLVEKTAPDHYLVYDGTITTCELPHPNWKFDARKVVVDAGGNATIYHSSFLLHGIPIFYFPYATHPVAKETRHSGFLIPTVGRSNTNGNEVGDSFYWAINRSMDGTIGGQYLSKRGFSQRGEFRARPSDTSYIDLSFFGVKDRGTPIETANGPQMLKEGGQEARLTAEGNFYGFRAVSNVDYLSSFIFRLAFNEVFTQAVNSEVKSQMFLAKPYKGYSFGAMIERYQNFFQTVDNNGSLSNPPTFDSIRILHTPSVDASSVDRRFYHTPFFWSFDASISGLSRSEPGFTTNVLGRFDLSPEISLPVLFHGWTIRPGLALHDTYYTERFVEGVAVNDPTNRQALETTVEIRPPVLEKVFDREHFGRKWKHVIEPEITYRYVTGVNNFANVLHFDEHDILSNTHEVGYGFVTRLYAKRPASSIEDCEEPMTGLAVGAAAPEQTVPWEKINRFGNVPCNLGPAAKELVTWQVFQKYFIDPTFGGALIPGQRNVFTTTEDLTGIAFITEQRHLSPLASRLRVETSTRTDTEWDMDYDFQLSRVNASTLLINYNVGPFTFGGGHAFLQIPQTSTTSPALSEGTCGPSNVTSQITCKFQQFRVALGYGSLTKRGLSGAASMGFDAETRRLQFSTTQATYNWDCCGVTLEYRRYAIANVRNENLFRFTFSLANIGSFGNLRRQERLY